MRSYRRQTIVLDSAVIDEVALVARLERLLGARVHSTSVERVDLVNDTTVVEVRYSYRSRVLAAGGARPERVESSRWGGSRRCVRRCGHWRRSGWTN